MRRIFLCIFWLLGVSLIILDLVGAQPVSSTELINAASTYDGKTVAYEGEIIGDIMLRGDYAWINVNDGKKAIGVWVEAGLIKEIVFTGSYSAKGDSVEVVGTFQRACIAHGGDLDIHAQAVRKVTSGRMILRKLNPDKRNIAVGLSAALVLIWILSLLKRS